MWDPNQNFLERMAAQGRSLRDSISMRMGLSKATLPSMQSDLPNRSYPQQSDIGPNMFQGLQNTAPLGGFNPQQYMQTQADQAWQSKPPGSGNAPTTPGSTLGYGQQWLEQKYGPSQVTYGKPGESTPGFGQTQGMYGRQSDVGSNYQVKSGDTSAVGGPPSGLSGIAFNQSSSSEPRPNAGLFGSVQGDANLKGSVNPAYQPGFSAQGPTYGGMNGYVGKDEPAPRIRYSF